MTAKEFKQKNRFRSYKSRTCENCAWCRQEEWTEAYETWMADECVANGVPFSTSNLNVCDNWKPIEKKK